MAVVLEYLEHLKGNIEVPTVTEKDQRLVLLRGVEEEEALDEGDEEHADDAPLSLRPSKKPVLKTMHSYLESQTKEQLIILLE